MHHNVKEELKKCRCEYMKARGNLLSIGEYLDLKIILKEKEMELKTISIFQ